MKKEFQRLGLLFGEEKVDLLANKHVAIFGIGGVGSYAAEAIARSNVGKITLVDFDDVDITNINRQIPALSSTIGKKKADVMKKRIEDINRDCTVIVLDKKYLPENREEFFIEDYDYIVDAIDIITSKIDLIVEAKTRNIPIISSMGMGNKIDPTKIKIEDIYKTHMCPLAKVLRKELKARNVKNLLTVFSEEQPLKPVITLNSESKKVVPGSTGFVPSVAGLIMASKVIQNLLVE
ncbi:hesa/moeb/thif family protein [Acetoanaerobium sticklandii]|uniref:Hesa/moeb/thif family protein n=1 Tax=Acetoanaerobium sticklandii (strain ATCC 12662 / DSM 519 / JCM 1433 / CCUG 9281 / NCIMB 10654 / HF) TaxID=499177 RepID=E3PSV1_ACESD|nr:tRNA threonylcarbamoyladenosine dehydratase [Acetoanaerobium sticklandii]CBH21955.1 hesa/moeb/thif family protein [Acetoanaerobium sticklandii]